MMIRRLNFNHKLPKLIFMQKLKCFGLKKVQRNKKSRMYLFDVVSPFTQSESRWDVQVGRPGLLQRPALRLGVIH